MAKVYATPGVYIEEKSAFPNSVVPVATAVPAFLGYTQKAILDKKDLTNVPTRISSFGEYLLYFGAGPHTTYEVKDVSAAQPDKIFDLAAVARSRYLLYYSIKLFFASGGSDCYIVSVGSYSDPISLGDFIGNDDNPNAGLVTLLKEPEPTMVVIPDAVLFDSADECYALQTQMLKHCGMDMRSRVAILDVHNGYKARTPNEDVVNAFREGIGSNFLDFGAAYYPWVETTITGADEVDFFNVSLDTMNDFMVLLQNEVEQNVKMGLLAKQRGQQINGQVSLIPTALVHTARGEVFDGIRESANLLKRMLINNPVEAIKTKVAAMEASATAPQIKNELGVLGVWQDKVADWQEELDAFTAFSEIKVANEFTTFKTDTEDNANTDLDKAKETLQERIQLAQAGQMATAASNLRAEVDKIAELRSKTAALPGDTGLKGKINELPESLKKTTTDIQESFGSADGDDPIHAAKTLQELLAIDTSSKTEAVKGLKKLVQTTNEELQAALTGAEEVLKSRVDRKTLHQTLLAISPLYKATLQGIRRELNLLPASGGMAGVYTMVDNTNGVFQSPANVSMGMVIKPAVNLTNDEQEDLNVPLSGKAVNAIRTFPGKGTLIWGARTLDGNSQDWRYVSVRRTVIYIEQSVKYAAEAYVFQPNTAATWTNMKAMVTNFLTNVWQQGALAGATAQDAFSVDVGLGTTMTPVDILDGIMRITVRVAITRPAEFIVITFQQKMQQS